MDLILWRHAEAEDLQAGADDLQRALSTRGRRQAQLMAQWLHARLPGDARVLLSPARRTRQTAAALPRPGEVRNELAPGAPVAALLAAAGWPDAGGTVLVVGHQPTLGATAAWLLGGQVQAWPLRKSAILWLRRRERDGAPQVLLHAALGVDLL